MSYNYDYDMKYTDNPYIDLLVHNTKLMAINSVVKNEREALKYETLESRRASDILISYKAGIPISTDAFVEENYVEMNRYYRMLAGLPPFPTNSEITAYRDENGGINTNLDPLYQSKYIPLSQYQSMVPENTYISIENIYLHEAPLTVLGVLESCGILDQIKIDYQGDDFKYIYHLGEKAVDPYKARTAENFSLLYCPMIQFEEIYYKFLKVFDRNRLYTIATIYSYAYAYGSEHYDNFIQILIILQTMIDIIGEVQEYIINKDVFDSRTIRYLFESYGIEYYKEIPVRYQLAMIKNVNLLLKYKSTNRNIVDICTLFGFPDIDVFTYYLLKVKKKEKADFAYYTSEDVGVTVAPDGGYVTEDMVGMENYLENYDLAFLRVPLRDSNASEYMEDKSERREYDYITKQDPFWDGISKADILTEQEKENYHNQKRNEILGKDFTCERTKYISVDAAIDITKMSYQISYFMNILFDKHLDEEKLMLDVDSHISSRRVRLNDLMVLMIALGYLYNGIEQDVVTTDMERNMTINGFNFDTDWTDIYNSLLNNTEFTFLAQDNPENPGNEDAFLCGRYEPYNGDIGSSIWDDMQNHVVWDMNEGYAEYTFDGYNDLSYPTYLDGVIRDGTYTDVYQSESEQFYHIIDITWTTGYEPNNNTEARFMNTSILDEMSDTSTDLERFNKLKEIYYTNTKLYDHLTYMMRTAESKRMYDIYKILYDSFMETELSTDFYNIRDENNDTIYIDTSGNLYKLNGTRTEYTSETTQTSYAAVTGADGITRPITTSGLKARVAKDYKEFLANRNQDLYNILMKTYSFTSKDEMRSYITSICDYAVYALEKYFDTEEWKYIYNLIPTHNLEFIQQCILKVVIFFKSWKTQMLDQTVSYIFDDNSDKGNYIHILDDMYLSTTENMYDKIRAKDFLGTVTNFKLSDKLGIKVGILEKIEMITTYQEPIIIDFQGNEKISPRDYFGMVTELGCSESVSIRDNVTFSYYMGRVQLTELDFIYEINNSEVTLIRYISDYKVIKLPETIEGYPCRIVSNGCFYGCDVEDVVIPSCYRVIE